MLFTVPKLLDIPDKDWAGSAGAIFVANITPLLLPHVGLVNVKLIKGRGLTVIATVFVNGHPAKVPFTVYVVETVGLAVTEAPVVADKPVAGDQVYVDAPLADNVVPNPVQTVPPVVESVPAGGAVTETVLVILVPQTVLVIVTE